MPARALAVPGLLLQLALMGCVPSHAPDVLGSTDTGTLPPPDAAQAECERRGQTAYIIVKRDGATVICRD